MTRALNLRETLLSKLTTTPIGLKMKLEKLKSRSAKTHARNPFNEKSTVSIIGEVDYDLLEGTEIEVEQIVVDKP